MIKSIELDPLAKFNYQPEEINNMLGFLPGWVMNEEFMDKPLKEALDIQYDFGLFKMSGQIITKDGIFQYPEDPDLYPLIKIQRNNETFYQYQYAIVAIVQKDGSVFVTRMD